MESSFKWTLLKQRSGEGGLEKYFKKEQDNLGCPPGNQALESGCPACFHGCPGRPATRFIKP